MKFIFVSFLKYLRSLPIQLLLSIALAMFLGQKLQQQAVCIFYTISAFFIDLLLLLLPFIVFVFILRGLLCVKQGSLKLVALIFGGVTISNCLALAVAYCFGRLTLPFFGLGHTPGLAEKFSSSVKILYKLDLPQLIGTELALAVGIFLGVILGFMGDHQPIKLKVRSFALKGSDHISTFLGKVFIPLLPIYVFGFSLKLSYDRVLYHLFHQYGKVFVLSMVLVFFYLLLIYWAGSGFRLQTALTKMKNMFPAAVTAFSTMSSAATMPLTLESTKKNTGDENFTDLVIPSTTNIHMLGDDLTIVMTAMTLMSVFGLDWPDVCAFIPFAFAFSIAKLSCVGIPGASVLVVLPVLQKHLGFSAEMISVLTTIYILQDPFGTTANVVGNGGFALILQRLNSGFKC